MSSISEAKASKRRSLDIDKVLKQEEAKLVEAKKEFQMILLGPGDSGKSTVLKQLRILHGEGFSVDEMTEFKLIAIQNILVAVKLLVTKTLEYEYPISQENEWIMQQCIIGFELPSPKSIPDEIVQGIQLLWQDPSIQKTYRRGSEFSLQDTTDYLMEHVERLSRENQVVTNEDILRLRKRTINITETKLTLGKRIVNMIDVGGQKSVRKYWLPYFEETVGAILFVASLASFDQVLEEDEITNRLVDSLTLFDQICSNKLLFDKTIVVFLNKTDLFMRKIETTSISHYFPDFPQHRNEKDFEVAKQFFRKKFTAKNKKTSRNLYVHFTNSTDTKLMRVVIKAITETIVNLHLQRSGLD